MYKLHRQVNNLYPQIKNARLLAETIFSVNILVKNLHLDKSSKMIKARVPPGRLGRHNNVYIKMVIIYKKPCLSVKTLEI